MKSTLRFDFAMSLRACWRGMVSSAMAAFVLMAAMFTSPLRANENKVYVSRPAFSERTRAQESHRLAGYIGVIDLAVGLTISLAGSALEDDKVTAIGLAMVLGGVVTISVSHYMCPTREHCMLALKQELWGAVTRQTRIYARHPELAGTESDFAAVARALRIDVVQLARLVSAIDKIKKTTPSAEAAKAQVDSVKGDFFKSPFADSYQGHVFENLVSLGLAKP